MTRQCDVVVDDVCFPEGLRWHKGALWYSDIGRGQVCRVVPGQSPQVAVAGIRHASGLGWTAGDDLLVTSITEGNIYRIGPDRQPAVWCGPAQHGTAWTNDMVTFGGRSYVSCGGMSYEPGNYETLHHDLLKGRVIVIDHETGVSRTAASALAMPNGAAITPDGTSFIVAETYGSKVSRFDIAPDGTLINRRLFATVDGTPDGLTLDADTAVWVGTGENFQRIDQGGNVVETFGVPGWACVACMLGGEDGRSLFLALGQFEDGDAIFAGKARGQIMVTRVDVPGAEPARP